MVIAYVAIGSLVRPFTTCILLALFALAPRAVRAEEPLEWDPQWRRTQPWEAVLAPLLIAGSFTVYYVAPDPDFDFAAGNSFDRELQETFSVTSDRYRRIMGLAGEVGFIGSMVYRGMEDIFIVGWARDGWNVAGQLVVTDALAFGMIGAVVWGSQVAVGRERPRSTYCRTDPEYAAEVDDCGDQGSNRSFISGHFAAAVAGASLTCLYHDRLPIYRLRHAGAGACGGAITAAIVTGVARITVDAHWMTDMLAGGALGFLTGWVVPRALHFGFRSEPADSEAEPRSSRVDVQVQPYVTARQGGLQARGSF